MPGDTKIKRTPNGWVDIDVPGFSYAARWQARLARRTRLATPMPSLPQQPSGVLYTSDGVPFTGLQQRLYDRLTQRQGASQNDAYAIVTTYGYNAAASYGHMREAGATHTEALSVIGLGSPSISLAYGQHRAVGYDHGDALRDALVIGGMDDDD